VEQEPEFMPAGDRAARAGSFATVASEYERGRPGYPREAIDWLLGTAQLEVLDLGAGTGKLTEAVLGAGHRVLAVEPLEAMRAILQDRLPAAEVHTGRAEQLPIEDASVDAVVVGAAFHWFDQRAALDEVGRVLRRPGVLGLLGNAFDTSTPWAASLREILGPPAIQRPRHWPSRETLRERYETVEDEHFPHSQRVTLSMLRDLALSRSSIAILRAEQRDSVLAAIETLWHDSPELAGAADAQLPWVSRARRCVGLR